MKLWHLILVTLCACIGGALAFAYFGDLASLLLGVLFGAFVGGASVIRYQGDNGYKGGRGGNSGSSELHRLSLHSYYGSHHPFGGHIHHSGTHFGGGHGGHHFR
jgi:hypothetical protein